MASQNIPADLSAMYTSNRFDGEVRDPRAHYGPGPMEPEAYPAELVLRDLRSAANPDRAVLVLARYAVLRAWLLGAETPVSPELRDHARAAAAAHLAATPSEWPERPLLESLLETDSAERATTLLIEAAEAAEKAGHIDGALGARTTAWLASVRAFRLGSGAEVAAGIAAFLRRRGGSVDAAEWDRIAARLGGDAPGFGAPSPS